MIRLTLVALVLIMSIASPAAACDPYWDDCWWWWEEPATYVEETTWWQEPAWYPEPVWPPEPVWYPEPVQEVWWWQEPAWAPPPPPAPAAEPVWQPAPEPAPVIPQGLYLVTEVYVADIVSVAGPLTTYTTSTVVETPGTYARVIDTVGTGAASAYDGSAFNGRTALDDGRGVAGTYYENFVLSNGEFVPVSVVFFQDDSALAAGAPPPPTPSPVQTPAPTPVPIAVVQPAPIPAAATPMPVATAPQAPPVTLPTEIARIDPLVEPPLAAAQPPSRNDTPPRPPVIRPGISASPIGEVRFEIEVLRGRAIPLWIRAAADGMPHPVASWRIRSGEHIALGPTSGGGDDALSARWDVVTPPGVAWILGVDVDLVIGGVPQSSFGEIAVVVRSPALVR